MNTPAHLIFGTAAFGRANDNPTTCAALAGAMAPDLSLYLMVMWSIWIRGVSPNTVFREYYYSPEWQQVFAVDNSFILWGMLLGFAIWSAKRALIAFSGAGLLHLALDFPLHNHDARMHFWPVTDWVFVSPFSYWDQRYHASTIAPIELILSMMFIVFLVARHKAIWSRCLIALLAGAEAMASGFFRWIL